MTAVAALAIGALGSCDAFRVDAGQCLGWSDDLCHCFDCGTLPFVCCVLILLAFFTPRIVLFILWVFTTYLSRAYDGFVLPFLGFLFLPATTLAYAIAQNELGGLNGLGLIVVLIGLAVDIGLLGGGASRRRG
jgi:hypothetical protein